MLSDIYSEDQFFEESPLTACISSYAGAFLDAKTMDGVDMYQTLLERYQGGIS